MRVCGDGGREHNCNHSSQLHADAHNQPLELCERGTTVLALFFRQVWSVGRDRAQRVYVESSNLALVIGIDDVVGAEGLHPLSATVLAAHKRLHHAAW